MTNESLGAAEDELRAVLFQIGAVQSVYSDEVERGLVAYTNPEQGALELPGTIVDIYVSAGPEFTYVPNVVGEDKSRAEDDLQQAGFNVEVREQAVGSWSEDNVVLDQSPSGGRSADSGSTVVILVGYYSSYATTTTYGY